MKMKNKKVAARFILREEDVTLHVAPKAKGDRSKQNPMLSMEELAPRVATPRERREYLAGRVTELARASDSKNSMLSMEMLGPE